MRRMTARSYRKSASGRRLMSMLVATLVLWMLYESLKDPATCRLIADDKPSTPSIDSNDQKSHDDEHLIPGPNDLNADEVAAAKDDLEAVDDRTLLKTHEMKAYWRLMNWSRTQPFHELESRAKDDVAITQLWEQPERYRGKLIRLHLHVVRVLEYDAPENSFGIAKVYEAWGSTDESRSFPYVVVFHEAPAGLPIGTDIRAEIVLVGYFLKIMPFKAFDKPRAAPLVVGRARLVSVPTSAQLSKTDPWIIPPVLICATALIGISAWTSIRSGRKASVKMRPQDLAVEDSWPWAENDNPFAQITADPLTPMQPTVTQR